MNSLTTPLGVPRQKKGKQIFKRLIVDEFLKTQEGGPRVRSSSKEFLAFVNVFRVFVVQQGEATTHNQKITKLMNHIAKNLGAIGPQVQVLPRQPSRQNCQIPS
jgi:hypothetical protein